MSVERDNQSKQQEKLAVINRILGAATPELITKCIDTLLDIPRQEVPFALTHSYLDLRNIRDDKIYPHKLLSELLVMNSQFIWVKLIQQMQDNQSGVETLRQEIHGSDPIIAAANAIASNNLKFFGATLGVYTAAIMYGTEHYPERININFKNHSSYAAGSEMSKLWEQPANSSDEIVDRLQTIFPPNQTDLQNIPAFAFAQTQKAFTGYKRRQGEKPRYCPADQVTGVIFTAYGNGLARPAYKRELIKRLQPPWTKS